MALDPEFKIQFTQLFGILGELRQRNLRPAIQWCRDNEERLLGIKSSLLFNLLKMEFGETLRQKGWEKAIQYARKNFQSFGEEKMAEI